jgi:hypothetical protein
MIKISVSKVAKITFSKRKDIQTLIKSGILQTHEGYVTLDSIQRAFPNLILDIDSHNIIKKTNLIKQNSTFNINKDKYFISENEKLLLNKILLLENKIKILENILRHK